jgi:cytochrome c peroxidase
MEHIKQATYAPDDHQRAAQDSRIQPWQRALVLALVTALATAPVAARGPGRPGIDALIDEPDELPSNGFTFFRPASSIVSVEPTQPLPGNPTVPGDTVNSVGPQALTISVDAVRGGPDGMKLGDSVTSESGELVVPLLGIPAIAMVNGKPAVPAVLAHIGTIDLVPPLVSLKTVPIPPVLGLERYVRDKAAAIALGKALFWDSKAGSDGQACASCHFSAGADSRMKNQINPGINGGDHKFASTATGGGGPNYTLKSTDFPFYRLKKETDRNSAIQFQSNDVVSSQGSFGGAFVALQSGGVEHCGTRPIDEFSVHGALTRRVATRNTPSVINAVFNFRNFWDGRANNVFNGNNPFGKRDTSATVLQLQPDGTAAAVKMQLANASLASQAVGPATNEVEMSCANKTFRDLGRKMVPLRALSTQRVHAQDSVLAPYRDPHGVGLSSTYEQMIKTAFVPDWWSATGTYGGYTQIEANFSMFWGLAIMAYESTLVSDEAPIDQYVGWAGHPANPVALTVQEKRGLVLFRGPKAMCSSCHKGAEFTSAGAGLQPSLGETNLVEQMFVGGGRLALYDNGFYNIGVRPTSDDIGAGGTDPFGNPLSFSREYVARLRATPAPDAFQVNPCLFSVRSDVSDCRLPPSPDLTRVGVDGAFKVPSLRNVALTHPYFHNGSRFTLEQVVDFYDRGGDRRGPDGNDSTGLTSATAADGGPSNVHPAIRPLGLTALEKSDLVAFLRNALTDQRVACQKAPFDHPELVIPHGHVGSTRSVSTNRNDVKALDETLHLAEAGANGVTAANCLKTDTGK